MNECYCPVCNRMLMKVYWDGPVCNPIIEVKCRCKSVINVTATGVCVREHRNPKEQLYIRKLPYPSVAYG